MSIRFEFKQFQDVTDKYLAYNTSIIDKLSRDGNIATTQNKKFDSDLLQDALDGYQLIVEAMSDREVIVQNMLAVKPTLNSRYYLTME